jgi:hypothetical protein
MPKIIDTADTMTSSKLSVLKKAGVETIIRYDDRRPRGGWKQRTCSKSGKELQYQS